jgi:hypothetical protein
VNDPIRSIATAAGPLAIRKPSPDTLAQLESLLPTVAPIEHEDRRLLALVPVEGPRVLHGLRTGYGSTEPQPPDAFARMLALERLRIVEATAAFRARRFRGALIPAACQTGSPGGFTQLGELLFLKSRAPLERGVGAHPVEGYDEMFGNGASDVVFSFITEIRAAWKAAGLGDFRVTDIEPCAADGKGITWRADIALVDDRIFVIRPELVPEDPLLSALVLAGVTEVEYAPAAFLLPPPGNSTGARDL